MLQMDKGGSWIACGSGLPRLVAVWPSLRPHHPPTPDDVVVAPVASSQCWSHRPVILPVTILVVAVIRGCPPKPCTQGVTRSLELTTYDPDSDPGSCDLLWTWIANCL